MSARTSDAPPADAGAADARRPWEARSWAAGALLLGLAFYLGSTLPRDGAIGNAGAARAPRPAEGKSPAPAPAAAFSPPPDALIPAGPFGDAIRLGQAIFLDTRAHAGAFVGNDLRCVNCHLDAGRLADSAPLWGAFGTFPTYRRKNDHVNTFAERLQGCFRFSMNGKAPPLGDPVLVAIESYAFFLATGAPIGKSLPGRGYPALAPPATLDRGAGRRIYAARCALCHGVDGAGQATADGHWVFPPLWGARSYNWGAGMSSIANAAGFIKANMPLSQSNTLTDQEAWDVAAYVDGRERPQDPRFQGAVAETRKAHHDSPFDLYGQTVDGIVLGENAPPSGTVGR